jgi:hypothetical protein
MRTLLFLVAGLVAGAVFHLAGRAAGLAAATAFALFAAAWTAVAAWNLYEGVAHAGYTVLEELPIFLVIALVPIAAVWWFTRRWGSGIVGV